MPYLLDSWFVVTALCLTVIPITYSLLASVPWKHLPDWDVMVVPGILLLFSGLAAPFAAVAVLALAGVGLFIPRLSRKQKIVLWLATVVCLACAEHARRTLDFG